MANRFGTEILQQQGARKQVKIQNDRAVNTFQNQTGSNSAIDASAHALSDKKLSGGALKWDEFYSVKSFFNSYGASESSAVSMALLAIDVSKMSGVSVMKIIEPLAADGELKLDPETYAALNIYRPPSSKQNLLLRNKNTDSLRKRNILI